MPEPCETVNFVLFQNCNTLIYKYHLSTKILIFIHYSLHYFVMNPFHILFYDRYKQFRARRLSSINPIEETLPHIFGLFRNNSYSVNLKVLVKYTLNLNKYLFSQATVSNWNWIHINHRFSKKTLKSKDGRICPLIFFQWDANSICNVTCCVVQSLTKNIQEHIIVFLRTLWYFPNI